MRKWLCCIPVIAMLGTVLSGCNNASSDTGSGNNAAGVAKLSMATGGTSGTYYGYSGIIAQVLNDKLKDVLSITVESTGASKANIQLLGSGDAQLAIVQNDVMSYAYEAKDMFEGESPIQDFSAVAAVYPEQIQIIANTAITSVEDLKGKKISVGDAGSGVEFNARQILEAYGLSFDDITVYNQSFADSADSLKNGAVDAAFITSGAPTTAVTELASNFKFNLVPIDDAHVKILSEKYGFYTPIIIPGGTYGPVTEDVQTVAVMATLVARNDVPENVIYEFTKALFDNKDEIAKGHAKGGLLDPKTAVSGIPIPFHAGAEKYYKEIGAK